MRGIAHIFVLLLALAAFAKPTNMLDLPKELQSEEVPWFAFSSKDSYGTYKRTINRDDLKELAKQKKYQRVVFSFFATWCIPCRDGLKIISDNSEELKKNGIMVVLVNVAEKDLENYSRAKIEEWMRQNGYLKDEWLLVFDKFSNSLSNFGLQKNGNTEAPLPRTLVADSNLRPLTLIGEEGDDYLQILWK
jgi:thiol-disulfide isomerase/thioredoxin